MQAGLCISTLSDQAHRTLGLCRRESLSLAGAIRFLSAAKRAYSSGLMWDVAVYACGRMRVPQALGGVVASALVRVANERGDGAAHLIFD